MRQVLNEQGARALCGPPGDGAAASAELSTWDVISRPGPEAGGVSEASRLSDSVGNLSALSVETASDADSAAADVSANAAAPARAAAAAAAQHAEGGELAAPKRLRLDAAVQHQQQLQPVVVAAGQLGFEDGCFFMKSRMPLIPLLTEAEAATASQAFLEHIATKAQSLETSSRSQLHFSF